MVETHGPHDREIKINGMLFLESLKCKNLEPENIEEQDLFVKSISSSIVCSRFVAKNISKLFKENSSFGIISCDRVF